MAQRPDPPDEMNSHKKSARDPARPSVQHTEQQTEQRSDQSSDSFSELGAIRDLDKTPEKAPEPPPWAGGLDERAGELEPLPSAELWLVDGYNALHCAPFRRAERTNEQGLPTDVVVLDQAVKHVAKQAGSFLPPRRRQSAPSPPFWSETMREQLVAFARRFPDPDTEIWLVFDGRRAPENPDRGERPRLKLHFAASADDWIVACVRGDRDPSRIAVVSGDRQLTGRSRHHGAAVVSPRLFLDHCLLSPAR